MIIERHFRADESAAMKAFMAKCKELHLYAQRCYISGNRHSVRVSGDALTPKLAEQLLDGHRDFAKSAAV